MKICVPNFYCYDEYIRLMPERKYPYLKAGFPKLCSLRPKWCVGWVFRNSFCLCVCHSPTVVLMLTAVNLHKDHHEPMDTVVRGRNSMEFMIHHCPNCPVDIQAFGNYLFELDEDDENDPSLYKPAVENSRLLRASQANNPVDNFNSLVVEKLNTLTAHSYIAKTQAKYLKKCEEKLKENEVIVLGDFAENYQFIIQGEIKDFTGTSSHAPSI